MTSSEYWRRREATQREKNIRDEAEYAKELRRIYEDMMDGVQKEIDAFYARYAAKAGITLAAAKRRADKLDIEAYERKAKKYVREKNFSKQANDEMRLYNLVMKVNRLELLKANIGLELVGGFDEMQKFFDEKLTDRTLSEFRRQAGILGESVQNNAARANAIVNASFHNATFSDRIWMYQDILKSELAKQLQIGLIQGKNPRELARSIRKRFDVSQSDAERLMITELLRVQIEADMQSLIRNGYEEYRFLAQNSACSVCAALHGKHFKVADMKIGVNAPPMHPNCHCSVSAYMDRAEFDEWLEEENRRMHERDTAEWERRKGATNQARITEAMILMNQSVLEPKYTKEAILDEMGRSPVGQDTIAAIENGDVTIRIFDTDRRDGCRGDQSGRHIRIFSSNCLNLRVAVQTLIHEMAHHRFRIGGCQHAEAICFAMEKMHLTGRNYLLPDEWEYVKTLAIDAYPEYNWEEGGYGDYGQFDFVRYDK